ncbi:MAG: VWA domain-containing protein [Bdellovibrionales bacterium]
MRYFSFWYILLFLPLVTLLIYSFLKRKKRRPSLQFSNIPRPARAHISLKAKFLYLPSILKAVALGLVLVALMRPQSSTTKIKRNVEGIDIVVALDISESMLIEDMKPENRLEASKDVIKKFVEGRISDRIGLVVFSGESYTRVPPTLDYPILQKSLSEVTTSKNMRMGTAIGVALANAVARLQDSTAKTRIVILLTDGASNTGTIAPEEALSIAKGYDVRVYTIGMGKEGEARLPVYRTDVFGRKIKTYQKMMSSVNISLLEEIATQTGGTFYRADDERALQEVFNKINALEKTKIDIDKYTRYSEEFEFYLKLAALLFLLGTFLQRTLLRRNP